MFWEHLTITRDVSGWAGKVAAGLTAALVSGTEVFCCPRGRFNRHPSQIQTSRFSGNHRAKHGSSVDDVLALTWPSSLYYFFTIPELLIQVGCRREELHFWCSQESYNSPELSWKTEGAPTSGRFGWYWKSKRCIRVILWQPNFVTLLPINCCVQHSGGRERFSVLAPLKCIPEASDDRRAVRAGDGFPLGAADVVQNVVASLHRDLHPGRPLCGVQRPRGSRQVLDVHVVFP